MWISKQMKPETATTDADLGVTTIAGGSVGVVTQGELRSRRLRLAAGKRRGGAGYQRRSRRRGAMRSRSPADSSEGDAPRGGLRLRPRYNSGLSASRRDPGAAGRHGGN